MLCSVDEVVERGEGVREGERKRERGRERSSFCYLYFPKLSATLFKAARKNSDIHYMYMYIHASTVHLAD
jgi:hypothetical protein